VFISTFDIPTPQPEDDDALQGRFTEQAGIDISPHSPLEIIAPLSDERREQIARRFTSIVTGNCVTLETTA
jgi:hypothetical protein